MLTLMAISHKLTALKTSWLFKSAIRPRALMLNLSLPLINHKNYLYRAISSSHILFKIPKGFIKIISHPDESFRTPKLPLFPALFGKSNQLHEGLPSLCYNHLIATYRLLNKLGQVLFSLA